MHGGMGFELRPLVSTNGRLGKGRSQREEGRRRLGLFRRLDPFFFLPSAFCLQHQRRPRQAVSAVLVARQFVAALGVAEVLYVLDAVGGSTFGIALVLFRTWAGRKPGC